MARATQRSRMRWIRLPSSNGDMRMLSASSSIASTPSTCLTRYACGHLVHASRRDADVVSPSSKRDRNRAPRESPAAMLPSKRVNAPQARASLISTPRHKCGLAPNTLSRSASKAASSSSRTLSAASGPRSSCQSRAARTSYSCSCVAKLMRRSPVTNDGTSSSCCRCSISLSQRLGARSALWRRSPRGNNSSDDEADASIANSAR